MIATSQSAVPGLTSSEVTEVFEPFVVRRLSPTDAEWLEAVGRLERRYAGGQAKPTPWLSPEGHRTPGLVKSRYESVWGRVSLEAELAAPKTAYFEQGGECLLARTIGRKRVHHLFLARALQWLAPASALEVGFGYGLNLLLLSMQFPDISFSGVELTEAGVAAATSCASDVHTAATLAPFAVGALRDREAPRRLSLRQGSAAALPLPDKSVDVAFTVLALEQMERLRGAALAELARVARTHVVMIEPFADWNTEPHRRGYLTRHDYFASTIEGVREYGLRPVLATADMPNKLSFRAGLVIAEVEPVPSARRSSN